MYFKCYQTLTMAGTEKNKLSCVVAKHIKGCKQMPLGEGSERLLSNLMYTSNVMIS